MKSSVRGYFIRVGSIADLTEEHRISSVEVDLDIVSPAEPARIAALAAQAEEMCYVMQAIKNPVEARLQVTLNTQPLPS